MYSTDTIVGVSTVVFARQSDDYLLRYIHIDWTWPVLAMIEDPSKSSWIQMVIRITGKTESSVPCSIINIA